ncbi:hypothetical protein ACLOJK_031336 [Asimina triloba]
MFCMEFLFEAICLPVKRNHPSKARLGISSVGGDVQGQQSQMQLSCKVREWFGVDDERDYRRVSLAFHELLLVDQAAITVSAASSNEKVAQHYSVVC